MEVEDVTTPEIADFVDVLLRLQRGCLLDFELTQDHLKEILQPSRPFKAFNPHTCETQPLPPSPPCNSSPATYRPPLCNPALANPIAVQPKPYRLHPRTNPFIT
ncbi:hypothetical protein L484_021145 [Morus notabilis]|uniref:Uncharacterized protein n=1 Tax=Morus notabilis TaxID=981085 RepID=W9QQG8_9ROSA|nr:hypothetical protein L484_021145 [Morus notabilis]